jgi:hypothetical protein
VNTDSRQERSSQRRRDTELNIELSCFEKAESNALTYLRLTAMTLSTSERCNHSKINGNTKSDLRDSVALRILRATEMFPQVTREP